MIVKAITISAMMLLVVACGDKDQDDDDTSDASNPPGSVGGGAPPVGSLAINLTAQGVDSVLEGAALRLLAPETENYGYPGIGMNYGEAVVEGFRVNLLTISLQSANATGGYGTRAPLFDFGAGKELEISEGFNGKIEASANVSIIPGTYTQLSVSTENAFSLKAYAYLDQDNDGNIDATVWTTAAEIMMDNQKLAPGSMPGYDWYRYPWLVATFAQSLTDNSAYPVDHTTNLPEPVVVAEDGIQIDGAAASSIAISLLVDTFRIIKVWDGRFGTGSNWTPGAGNAAALPFPVFPFPQGATDSRGLSGTLKTYDLFPPSKPHFALGNYLSMFGFVNETGLKAQNYLVSKTEEITPYNTQVMTVILDSAGAPLFGKFGLGESNETLHIGPIARKFEAQADGSYTFGTAYGMKDASGQWDGGLYSSDDLAKAGHLFSSFRKLGLGQRAEMTMTNGPRCNDEYDYCVDAAGVSAYFLRAQ